MKKLLYKIKLTSYPGSALLETITAAVIFMIVFLMAMDTLTRLLTFEQSDTDYLLIENDINKSRRKLLQEELRPEEKSYQYQWGEVKATISPYRGNVFRVELTAISNKEHRRVYYRFLFANP